MLVKPELIRCLENNPSAGQETVPALADALRADLYREVNDPRHLLALLPPGHAAARIDAMFEELRNEPLQAMAPVRSALPSRFAASSGFS